MRAADRQPPGSHEDARLSQLYQQVTEMQAPRFEVGYHVEKGLERYKAWLSEHAGSNGDTADQADSGAAPDRGPLQEDPG